MPDELNAIVQRMIDAGESEENIGTVIQHFKPKYQPDPTTQGATARAMARDAGMLGVNAPTEQHEPDTFWSGVGKSLKDQILGATVGNPQLQGAAHPSSAGDVASLVFAPTDATRSGTAQMLRGYLRAGKEAATGAPTLRSIPGRMLKVLYRDATETAPTLERSGMAGRVDPYAPNTSSSSLPDPREPLQMADAPVHAPSIPQGVYTQLPDGSWGVKALPGFTLRTGDVVNVMNRAGHATVHVAGDIGPDGIAAIGEHAAMPSTEPMFVKGQKGTDSYVRDLIQRHLKGRD